MSTPPSNITFYSITQTSAYIQWYVNGGDTNFTDLMCNDASGKTVWSSYGISTRSSQYYSDMVVGLKQGQTYHCYVRTKADLSGATSDWVYSGDFTTTTSNTQSQSNKADIQSVVYLKTNIAGYFFDAFLQVTHATSVTVTEHPVESGAAVSDHSYVNPAVLTMLIGMSDVATSVVSGQFMPALPSRSRNAYQVLLELQKQRMPLQVYTRLNLYQNMVITDISVPEDYTTVHALKATVTMREVFVATVKTVKISARPHVTDSTNAGPIDVLPIKDESALLQLSKSYGISLSELKQRLGIGQTV